MICENPACRKDEKPLYQVPGNRFVCFDCVTPEQWAEYPGSRELAQLSRDRAARARVNFGHAEKAKAA
jgi:hypothetical protein